MVRNGSKGKIYFAHPYESWKSKEEFVIEHILPLRGYEVVNPFNAEKKLLDKYKTHDYYSKPTRDFAEEIYLQDYYTVMECDAYFGWFKSKGAMIGTSIELAWAYQNGKKILALCEKPHPFIWSMVDIFYSSLDGFIKNEPFYKRYNGKGHKKVIVK